ncbi:MAG TPA: hypothetical protein PK402_07575 [Tepidisphaeraceae bacterium]|nr:hypothetical protein [Tepidisphaeraceae bacterium]
MFQLLQTIYWIGLSSWFGSAVFLLLIVGTIFAVMRDQDPTLPKVLSVNIDGDHGVLLSIHLFTKLARVMTTFGFACAGAVLIGLAGQFVFGERAGPRFIDLIVRVGLMIASLGVMIYDRFVVTPKLASAIASYIDQADDPEATRENRERVIRAYHEAIAVLGGLACALGGLILFSANFSQAVMTVTRE